MGAGEVIENDPPVTGSLMHESDIMPLSLKHLVIAMLMIVILLS